VVKRIAWKHLEDLYIGDSGAQRDQPVLSLVPKLKYEHIHLISFSQESFQAAIPVWGWFQTEGEVMNSFDHVHEEQYSISHLVIRVLL